MVSNQIQAHITVSPPQGGTLRFAPLETVGFLAKAERQKSNSKG
jgi:hypothetical protein